jgi:hypothetical protein
MRRLLKGWKLIGIIFLSILVVVAAMSCTGPQGPQGPAGPAGVAGPTKALPVIVATPNTATLKAGKVSLTPITFTGAGWDPAEGSVYIELMVSSTNVTMVVGTQVNASGAFTGGMSAAAGGFAIPAGVYT